MLIKLQEPFKSNWTKGYLRISREQRRIVDLYNSDTDRTSISYARYLMCVKIGYILSNDLDVDHIDNDKTNDNIGNLQILTKLQNKIKETNRYLEEEQLSYGYICACCQAPFILAERLVKGRLAQNVVYAFCGKSCSARFHAINKSIASRNLKANSVNQ